MNAQPYRLVETGNHGSHAWESLQWKTQITWTKQTQSIMFGGNAKKDESNRREMYRLWETGLYWSEFFGSFSDRHAKNRWQTKEPALMETETTSQMYLQWKPPQNNA